MADLLTVEVVQVYRCYGRRYLARTGAIRAMARREAREDCTCDPDTGYVCGCQDELKDREREIRQRLKADTAANRTPGIPSPQSSTHGIEGNG